MFRWLFSSKERKYRQLKKDLHLLAEDQAGGMNLETELEIVLVQGMNPLYVGLRPRSTARGTRVYTPRQLEYVLKLLLTFEPVLAAYMVTSVLPRTLPRVLTPPEFPEASYNLPITFQGDLMIALEKIRAVAPELVEQGASVLARALCMMPSLKKAQETYSNLGAAYTEAPLTERELEKLLNEKFVPDSTIRDAPNNRKRLVDDTTIRHMVYKKLQELNPQAAELIGE